MPASASVSASMPAPAPTTTGTPDAAIVPTSPLWGAATPEGVVERAAEVARVLAGVIDRQQLYVAIQGRRYVRVEGWTLLGTLLGVYPVTVWCRPFVTSTPAGEVSVGWEARVEARTLAGALVGAAEAQCTRDEPSWRDRPDFALRSMAQTRATSKALRLPLGFVAALAGYEPTPAEEIEGVVTASSNVASGASPSEREREQAPAPSSQPSQSSDLATEAQLRKAWALAKQFGFDEQAFRSLVYDHYHVNSIRALTKAQASELIEFLLRANAGDGPGSPGGPESFDTTESEPKPEMETRS